jgi:putative multiple sugar transport system ATP-binding protein
VRAGEVHALLGANGAGKSTRLYPPDAGETTLFDRPVNFTGAADAMAAGVSVIYQDFALIAYLGVAENIFLGNEILGPLGLVDWTATHREARRLLDLVGCAFPTETIVWELGTGQRQLVEVAEALLSPISDIHVAVPVRVHHVGAWLAPGLRGDGPVLDILANQ